MSKKLTTEEFINRAKQIHNDKYDYSLIDYKNNRTKVQIICNQHGIFEQIPYDHIKGIGCSSCAGVKKLTQEQWIQKAVKVHGNKYDYSNVEYKLSNTKVEIICNKHKKSFWQTPNNHLNGQNCPFCCESKGEEQIRRCLESNNIEFKSPYRFKNCRDKRSLPFDFYLPKYKLLIEFDGKQHYAPWSFLSNQTEEEKNKNFVDIQRRDKIKTEYTINNGFNLIRIPYWKIKSIEQILENKINLIKKEKQ
jgi:very-short-patch-repair endonuclease